MPENTDTKPAWQFDLTRFDEGDDEDTSAGTDDNDGSDDEDGDSAGQSNSGDEGTSDADGDEGDDEAAAKKAKADDGLGDKGKKAIAAMKAERDAAKKEAREARKDLAATKKRVDEFEDRDRSDLEKATKRAETLEKRAAAATARAVKSEVKALAAEKFEDPSDATAFLNLTEYAADDGEIDSDQIAADIAELLEKKPHLAKRTAVSASDADTGAEDDGKTKVKQKPKADRSQGSRGSDLKTDFRTATPEEVAAEQARYGYRNRW